MENASKALIMAATILLGIMIISVGVALFNSFGGFSEEITKQIEETKIQEFNTQFLKYYGKITSTNEDTGKTETNPIKITAHDVVTLANLASKNNVQHDVEEQIQRSDNTYYIQIELLKKYKNMEKLPENVLTDFIKENDMIYDSTNNLVTKYYYIANVEVSSKSGRVIYVQITEF